MTEIKKEPVEQFSAFLEICKKDFAISDTTPSRVYVMTEFSDSFDLLTFSQDFSLSDSDVEKLLDIRIFNEKMEYRLFRSNIGSCFHERKADDTVENFYDDIYYLDVDTNKTLEEKDGYVYTTGGGRYHLPDTRMQNAGIRIRYYMERDDFSSVAKVTDWRIVELVEV